MFNRSAIHFSRGFTLTELALAMGVISFALVAILGLLSSLVDNEQEISNRTFVSEISAKAIHDIKVEVSSNTTNPLPSSYILYYTQERARVLSEADASYVCEVSLESLGTAGGPSPGDSVKLLLMKFRKANSGAVLKTLHASITLQERLAAEAPSSDE